MFATSATLATGTPGVCHIATQPQVPSDLVNYTGYTALIRGRVDSGAGGFICTFKTVLTFTKVLTFFKKIQSSNPQQSLNKVLNQPTTATIFSPFTTV
jgi:hypothetical protein